MNYKFNTIGYSDGEYATGNNMAYGEEPNMNYGDRALH